MGERGWVAPTWPASEGGAGLDAIRAAIVAREFTRSGAPPILAGTTLLPAIAIRNHGSEQLQREVLPGIANGTIRVCLGYTEPDAGSDLAAVRTRAVRDGDEWILNGQKMFTTGAQFCQYSFCLTRTNPDVAKHKGLTVFLVPLDLPGIEIRGIGTVGGERTNFVHYDDVRVPDHFRLGAVDAGWTVVSEPLAQEHGIGRDDELAIEPPGSYVNTTRRLLAAVVDELRDAVDDAGRPRLEDPSVLERLGRVAVDIEATEVTPRTDGAHHLGRDPRARRLRPARAGRAGGHAAARRRGRGARRLRRVRVPVRSGHPHLRRVDRHPSQSRRRAHPRPAPQHPAC